MILLLKSKLIIVVGVILVAFGLFYSHKKNTYRRHCIDKQEIKELNKSNVFEPLDIGCLDLSFKKFTDEINISKSQNTLILRIPRFSCGSCVNREIGTIDKYLQGNISDTVITIVDFDQHRLFSAYSKSITPKRFKMFNYNKVLTKLDKKKKPYLILVNNDCKILDVFVVDKQDANATKLFLNSLK